MVKSELIEKEDSIDYPCLMENHVVVVLFKSPHEGGVVHRKKETAVPLGSIMKDNFQIGKFTKFEGSIHLSNS
jgi:hypothetical protein